MKCARRFGGLFRFPAAMLAGALVISCGMRSGEGWPRKLSAGSVPDRDSAQVEADREAGRSAADRVRRASAAAELPPEYSEALVSAAAADWRGFEAELAALTSLDPYLWAPVDKVYALAERYEPGDLKELIGPSYRVNRSGLHLRADAAEALEAMAAAARAEGLVLTVSSAYRSFAYQAQVYERLVRQLGQEAADRVSARPGHSEHQLGRALDFGSIDDSFAGTAEGRWLAANAGRFGWVLSYPDGLEDVTGYKWESWHYRYVGVALVDFIRRRFDGIKHYACRFLYQWAEDS